MVGHTCHPRTGEVEAGKREVQGQPGLHSEFMAKQHKPLKSETKLLLDTAGLSVEGSRQGTYFFTTEFVGFA